MKYVLLVITTVAYIALIIGVPAAILSNFIWPLREKHMKKKAHEAMYHSTKVELEELKFIPERFEPDARSWEEQPD